MEEFAKQNHTYHLSTKEFKRYQGQWRYHLEYVKQKSRLCDFDQNFDLQSLSKKVFTVNLPKRLQNQFLHSNIGDGSLSEAIPGGTRLTGVGGAHKKFYSDFFFDPVGFVYSRWRSTVTDGVCGQIHFTSFQKKIFKRLWDETASGRHESREPEPYVPSKDFDDWDFTFNGYAGTLDLAYPALLKAARQSTTVVTGTPPLGQRPATLLYLLTMLTQKGARKVVRKAGNNGFEAHRQLCMMYGTFDHEGRMDYTCRS